MSSSSNYPDRRAVVAALAAVPALPSLFGLFGPTPEEAHRKICPYSHATRGNVEVTFEVIGG